MKKIAIFIGKSLLIQGALSYFQHHSESMDVRSLEVVNPEQALTELKSFAPDIIIIEAKHLLSDTLFSQISILEMFPHLVLFELHVDSPTVRIIRSEQRRPATFEELFSSVRVEENSIPSTSVQTV